MIPVRFQSSLSRLLVSTAVNRKHISIFMRATAIGEPVSLHTRTKHLVYITYSPCNVRADKHLGQHAGFFCQDLFNDYYLGRQLARIVPLPQLQRINLTVHLLSSHSHTLRCSLNSAAFQGESAQPGDHPL